MVEATLTQANFPALRYINFCGNYGDPIYHPQFHQVIAHIRREGFKPNRDQRLLLADPLVGAHGADPLADQVQFSIDGLEDTNHLYRVNARWRDILAAIEAARARLSGLEVHRVRHNQHQIHTARKRAQTRLRRVPSDPLESLDGRWRDRPARTRLSRTRNGSADGRRSRSRSRPCVMARVRIEPRCARGKNVFISSEGYLLPCCYAHILLRRTIAATRASARAARRLVLQTPGIVRPHPTILRRGRG